MRNGTSGPSRPLRRESRHGARLAARPYYWPTPTAGWDDVGPGRLINMTEPVRPPPYPLTAMEPSWFEQLCWRLLLIDHPTVRFIENPDGGVDAILPSEDGTSWVGAWQAKRYTGHVKWGECEFSYDSAIANYNVLHLTFCFARDLTGAQERTFVKRLGQRRKGVLCDWVGRGTLHQGLTAS